MSWDHLGLPCTDMTPRTEETVSAPIPDDRWRDICYFHQHPEEHPEPAFTLDGYEERTIVLRLIAAEQRVKLLTDPAAVHINILRGDLPLTKAQAIHIAGLPADIEQQVRELREALRPVSDEEWKRAFHIQDSVGLYMPRHEIDALLAARDAAQGVTT